MNPSDIIWSSKKDTDEGLKEGLYQQIDDYMEAKEVNDYNKAKESLKDLQEMTLMLLTFVEMCEQEKISLNLKQYQFKLKNSDMYTILDEDDLKELKKK